MGQSSKSKKKLLSYRRKWEKIFLNKGEQDTIPKGKIPTYLTTYK